MGSGIHTATVMGHKGYYNPRTGRVKFDGCIYSNIQVAMKYLKIK
jgi:hypothetical protein